MAVEKIDPFSQAENCFTKAVRVTSDTEASANFMVARALSMNPKGFYAASEMNRLANGIPKWAALMLAYTLTPKAQARRGGYIKKPKSSFTQKEERIMVCLQKHLNCSAVHAADTYEMLKATGFDFDKYYGTAIMK